MQEQNAGFPTQAAEVAMDDNSYQVSHTGCISEWISCHVIIEHKRSYLLDDDDDDDDDDADDDDDDAIWSMILAIFHIIS